MVGDRLVVPGCVLDLVPCTVDVHLLLGGGPSDEEYGLLWWIIEKPKQVGYYALGFGGQLIVVLPKSRAVIVYMSDVQPEPDSQIDGRDLEPLDNVFISAFPR